MFEQSSNMYTLLTLGDITGGDDNCKDGVDSKGKVSGSEWAPGSNKNVFPNVWPKPVAQQEHRKRTGEQQKKLLLSQARC